RRFQGGPHGGQMPRVRGCVAPRITAAFFGPKLLAGDKTNCVTSDRRTSLVTAERAAQNAYMQSAVVHSAMSSTSSAPSCAKRQARLHRPETASTPTRAGGGVHNTGYGEGDLCEDPLKYGRKYPHRPCSPCSIHDVTKYGDEKAKEISPLF